MRTSLAMIATLALAGCATDKVTLLEGEADHPVGALAVLSDKGEETVLDRANSQALLRSGTSRVREIDGIDPSYTEILDTLPPPAKPFELTFPIGDSRITEAQRPTLWLIEAELASRPGAQIEVAGFTDSTGDAQSNNLLSLERARAVASSLREAGFDIDPGDAVGRGEDRARAALGDNVADERYRRVEIIIR